MKSSKYALALAVAGATTFGAATIAAADNDSGLYIGGGAGQFNVEIDDVGTDTFDADDNTYKVFAGWRFNPYVAVELNYIDFGNPSDDIDDFDIESDFKGYAPYVVGTLPVGPVELFAKVGYLFYDFEVDVDGVGFADNSDEDFVYGAGVGITLFEHLHARLEYEVLDVEDVDEANALWASAAWRF